MAGRSSESFRYTPYYCEENVWHLCRQPSLSAFEKEAVFISNPQRACWLWEQKASALVLPSVNAVTYRGRHWAAPWVPGERVIAGTMASEPGSHVADSGAVEYQRIYGRQYSSQGPVCGDYHVILMVRQGVWTVWDLDSRLSLPTDFKSYFQKTFALRPRHYWQEFPPLFRVLEAAEFVAKFDSDRSHMRTPQQGWKAPPPPWPPIRSPGGHPLQSLIDVEQEKPGKILTMAGLGRRYGLGASGKGRSQESGRRGREGLRD